MVKIHYFDKVNVDNIDYMKPKKLQTQYRSAIYYCGLRGLFIQSSKISKIQQFKRTNLKYLNVTIDDGAFLKFIKTIDMHSKKTISKKSMDWFGAKLTNATVKHSYKSPLKRNNNTAEFMLKYDEYGDIVTQIYDELGNELCLDNLNDYSCYSMILELNGLLFCKSEMLCEWSILQIKCFCDNDIPLPLPEVEHKANDEFFNPYDIVYDDNDVCG